MSPVRTAHACTLLLATLAVGPMAAQASGDATRYAILFSDRHAGFYKEWRFEGELHSMFDSAGGKETLAHAAKISSGGPRVMLIAEAQTVTF